jgi:hypothetical protein
MNVNEGEYTNIDDLQLREVVLYPNPTNNSFTTSGDFEKLWMTITDLNGAVLVAQREIQSGTQQSIQDLAAGVYMVSLRSNKSIVHKRIVKY